MRWTIGRKIGASFSTLIVSIVLLAVVSVGSISQLNENAKSVDHSYAVIGSVADILNQIVESENNSRAYLITGAEYFLPVYGDAIDGARTEFSRLTDLTAGDPNRRQDIAELEPLLSRYGRFSAERIRLRQSPQGLSTDWNMFEGEDKELLDAVRNALGRIRDDEKSLVIQRSSRAGDGVATVYILTGGVCALGLLVSSFSLFALVRGIVRPVRTLTGGVTALGAGAESAPVAVEADDEIGDLATMFNDVAARLREQGAEVKRSQKLFQRLFESVPDSIVVVDNAGKIVLANPRASETFGIGRNKLVGAFVETLMPERYRDRHLSLRTAFLKKPKAREMGAGLELYGLRSGGEEFPIEISLSPLSIEDEVLILAVIRDITERTRFQHALRQANADLELKVAERTEQLSEAVKTLEINNRELQEFAYVASHDLQEPLRKIQAFSDRLVMQAGPAFDEKSRDYLDRMNNAAGRMQILIDDLLAYSRVTTKANPFLPADLNTIATEVLSDLEILIERKGAVVELGDLPPIECDPTQMRQIFQNLVGNALKFQKPGQTPHVRISAVVQKSQIVLTISDNGIGFDEKYLEKIFAPFQRLHGRNEYEGTGIGLAVVRKIADRHGGNVTAISKLGEGASFIVTLPVKQKKQRR